MLAGSREDIQVKDEGNCIGSGVLKSTKKCCIRWGGGGECQSNFSGSDLSATKICIQTQALRTRSERDFTCGFFMNSCSSTVRNVITVKIIFTAISKLYQYLLPGHYTANILLPYTGTGGAVFNVLS